MYINRVFNYSMNIWLNYLIITHRKFKMLSSGVAILNISQIFFFLSFLVFGFGGWIKKLGNDLKFIFLIRFLHFAFNLVYYENLILYLFWTLNLSLKKGSLHWGKDRFWNRKDKKGCSTTGCWECTSQFGW